MARLEIGTIEIDLHDPESIDNAIIIVEDLEHNVKAMLDALCEHLLAEGVKIAKMQLLRFGVPVGPLYNSIKQIAFNPAEGVGYITAGEGLIAGNTTKGYPLMSYAVFIEKGSSKGDKTAKAEVKPAAKTWSPTLKLPVKQTAPPPAPTTDDGWVYLNEKDDHFYYTHGQPPKPFMQNTFIDLRYEADKKSKAYVNMYLHI